MKPDVNCDLVVAAAARVNLLAEVAKLLGKKALDGHVNILVVFADRELPLLRKRDDAAKGLPDLRGLGLRHDGPL